MKTFFRLLALYLIVLLACVHKPFVKPAAVIPPTKCDTTAVGYAHDIQPILKDNCYQCHGSATANGGLDLENFTSLKNYLELGFRGDGLYGSKFFHCILHSNYALPMPPTYVLDSCSLGKIKAWIDKGAPGN